MSVQIVQAQPLNGTELMIVWAGGKISLVPNTALQLNCRCANCVDEITGKKLIQETAVDPNARLLEVIRVGNYGLRFRWSKGCESGIFSFDHLAQIDLEYTATQTKTRPIHS